MKIAAALLGLVLLGGGLAWALWPEPEPEVVEPVPERGDTGMSEEAQIRMMEAIGYIQQE